MSKENVEIVKNAYRGLDERGVDGFLEFIHEDVEYLPLEEGGAVHGHDALRRYFVRWMEPWEEFHVGPTEFRESGEVPFMSRPGCRPAAHRTVANRRDNSGYRIRWLAGNPARSERQLRGLLGRLALAPCAIFPNHCSRKILFF